jgi:hypothetical protein
LTFQVAMRTYQHSQTGETLAGVVSQGEQSIVG